MKLEELLDADLSVSHGVDGFNLAYQKYLAANGIKNKQLDRVRFELYYSSAFTALRVVGFYLAKVDLAESSDFVYEFREAAKSWKNNEIIAALDYIEQCMDSINQDPEQGSFVNFEKIDEACSSLLTEGLKLLGDNILLHPYETKR